MFFVVQWCMDNEDARRLSPAEQHERRRQVIRAHKRKLNKKRIVRDVGLSYSATCKIIDRYAAEDVAALTPRKRGQRSGDRRVLSMRSASTHRAGVTWKRGCGLMEKTWGSRHGRGSAFTQPAAGGAGLGAAAGAIQVRAGRAMERLQQ